MSNSGEPAVVNDRYEIERRVGRGGMADVFLAKDLLLARPVALDLGAGAFDAQVFGIELEGLAIVEGDAQHPALVAQQERLLDALWPLLARGGRLVYAVCSVLPAESSSVLSRALARFDDARLLPAAIAGARELPAAVQILPGSRDMDGFGYGVLEKR